MRLLKYLIVFIFTRKKGGCEGTEGLENYRNNIQNSLLFLAKVVS